MEDWKTELLAAIDNDHEALLAFLQKLVQTPSPNPPGDTQAAIGVVEDFLHSHDIDTRLIAPQSTKPNIVASFDAHQADSTPGPTLVLNGHIDVFRVENASDWQRDPYSGAIENGFCHGRGTVDMKAGTAALVAAYVYLHARKDLLNGRLALTVVSDEETGGKWGSRYLLDHDGDREIWRGDCVLNAEPTGLDTIRFGEKGTLRTTFTIKAEAAHGAYIHRTEGAIRIASRVIQRLLALETMESPNMPPSIRAHLLRSDVRARIDQVMGAGAAASMLHPTVNIGTIHGGVKVNMIPSTCVFEVDIRLPIGLTTKTILDEIREMLQDVPEASFEVQSAASNPASASAPDHHLVDVVRKNAELVRGRRRAPLAIPSMGATDCKFWRYARVPAYSFGVSPETMAAVDERVSVKEFIDLVKIQALAAAEYLMTGGSEASDLKQY
ncbi:hypothetical protein B0A48_04554 [Cryoendolithus antarcticus]|uniref:Peptidase M20 dimerisation domain-containing protein n=1 Tax=Cryoendolithus antarcticus TaxID=1507870 RepID=A0A1V8TFN9_9PEZI|nr:hypothetical protein B0A48_04554 [Cryoendolithus antarcticus]